MRVLSLGAGVQSTALALMASNGDMPPLDFAVFADTGWEPQSVYDHLSWLREELAFPVHVTSAGDLKANLILGKNLSGGTFFWELSS